MRKRSLHLTKIDQVRSKELIANDVKKKIK